MLQIRKFSRNISYYEVLGVKPNCSNDEIKQAFYSKSKLYHPDMKIPTSDELRYKSISLAYNTLSNARERKEYDKQNNFIENNANYNHMENSEYFWSHGARNYRERNKFKNGRTFVNTHKNYSNNFNFNEKKTYANVFNEHSNEPQQNFRNETVVIVHLRFIILTLLGLSLSGIFLLNKKK